MVSKDFRDTGTLIKRRNTFNFGRKITIKAIITTFFFFLSDKKEDVDPISCFDVRRDLEKQIIFRVVRVQQRSSSSEAELGGQMVYSYLQDVTAAFGRSRTWDVVSHHPHL